MMTYQEVAAWWNVPVGTIHSWVARGRIPYVRLADRTVRFEREALEAWVAERRSTTPTVKAAPENGGAGTD